MTLRKLKSLMLMTFSAAFLYQASAAELKITGEANGYIQNFSSSTKAAVKDAESKSVTKWVQSGYGFVKFAASEEKGGTTYSAVVSGEADTGKAFTLLDTYAGMSMDSGLSIKVGGVRGSAVWGDTTVGKDVESKGGASHYKGTYARQRKGAVFSFATGGITAELATVMYSTDAVASTKTAEKSWLGIRPYFKYSMDMFNVDFAYDMLNGDSTDSDDKDKRAQSGFALNAEYTGTGLGITAGFNYGSGSDEVTSFTPAAKATTKKVTGLVEVTPATTPKTYNEVTADVAVAEVKESKIVATSTPATMGVYFAYAIGNGMGVGLNYTSTADTVKTKVDGNDSLETKLTLNDLSAGFSHKLSDTTTYYVSYATSASTSEQQKDAAGKDLSEKFKYQQDVSGFAFKMVYEF